MDKSSLLELDIEKGRRLVKQLDKDEVKICSAFWLFSPDISKWELILSSPTVKDEGYLRFYTMLINSLDKVDEEYRLDFKDILGIQTDSQIIKLFSSAVRTEANAISTIRLSSTVINGQLIDDALIYRNAC